MPLVPPDDPQNPFTINVLTVDADYFELLGASLRDGRLFEPADRSAVIINTTLAQRLWGREDVAGEILPVNAPPGAQAPRWEIVGVIRDIAYGHPSADPELIAYRLITGMAFMESILIESTSSAADLQRELQRKIDDGELGFRINSIRSVEELSSEVFAPDRARTGLTAAAATLVVILAAFGFYGTQRFLVAAGRREYAIRGAVGAGPRALGRLVLARGLILGLPGLVLGGLLAFIVVAWMRDDFISETVPPLTVTALVTLAIMSILLVATLGPARQARKIEPAPLLREE